MLARSARILEVRTYLILRTVHVFLLAFGSRTYLGRRVYNGPDPQAGPHQEYPHPLIPHLPSNRIERSACSKSSAVFPRMPRRQRRHQALPRLPCCVGGHCGTSPPAWAAVTGDPLRTLLLVDVPLAEFDVPLMCLWNSVLHMVSKAHKRPCVKPRKGRTQLRTQRTRSGKAATSARW